MPSLRFIHSLQAPYYVDLDGNNIFLAKMLSNVLLLSVLTVTSMSKTESSQIDQDICKNLCSCEDKENALNINCENKGFTTIGQIQPPQNRISQLFLNGNFLTRLNTNDFFHYGNVTSLHLGNNGLQEIKTGAFSGLKNLKRIHLNNNNLEIIKEETFSGLDNLEYLQADYNYISIIEAGAFNKLNKLKVLILNDNLLLSLPNNIFRFVMLTHLDLRGNRLKMLPFTGVLEHIGGIMEIQLEENPWNCTCDLIPLKAWLDTISVFVGDIVCETPFRLHGKDVTHLIKQDLCPRRNVGDSSHRAMEPSSDSQYHIPLPTLRARVTPTRAPKASRPPKTRHRPTPRVTSGKDKHVFGPIMVYQTRAPLPLTCPSVCMCTSQNSDTGLNINCQERKLHNISDLQPKPSYPKKLHLTGNYLQVIYRTDLMEYSSLELLHLGNNRLSIIMEGAFENLSNLRRLYLNGNYIESLSQSLFSGLQSLQYLYLEYNIIKDILPQTFNALHNLQLLFLNNNLLRSLPDNIFAGTMLTRLNLRNNHFSHLPVQGVLDQLSPFIQIDLQENPWDCTCDIIALKNWMELSSTSVVVNEITCDSPSKHAGRLLRSLRNDAICTETNQVTATKQPGLNASSSTEVTARFLNNATPTESHVGLPEIHADVPLSVLILGLLVVFILSVCFGAGLFVFVLKRRKGIESIHTNVNNLDVNSYQIQYSSYSIESRGDKMDTHEYTYVPHVGQMCQNPIYIQKDSNHVAFYRNLKGLSFNTTDLRKDEVTQSPTFSISTVEYQSCSNRDPELYQNIGERVKELPTAGPLSYNFSTLPKRSVVPSYDSVRRNNQDRLNKTALYGTPRKYFNVQPKSDQTWLHGKFKTQPDYLEVLERHTVMSQL
ncbi:SLIT and NTRK-like protein 2 [Alosa sapidissima]|uniref:SLIT and NTRK-like protein 2 n=1 Tax=Alosa sapidissima TaxID=34773 RepID=UPI001C089916|nr:SLIT and NTRK-like protein 2 [Alosa sapidissima]